MDKLRNSAPFTFSGALSRMSSLSTYSYGRSPAYRRLLSSRTLPLRVVGNRSSHDHQFRFRPAPQQLCFLSKPNPCPPLFPPSSRLFHTSPPSSLAEQGAKTESKSQDAQNSEPASESRQGPTTEGEAAGDRERHQRPDEEGSGEEGKKDHREDAPPPPPPPHGDKTPWQVFLETMQSEFKQSKEWNESTKALASSAHQFTESESVRRARQAYENTSGAVSSTATNVVKTTAGAIGKGAAWTWETSMMKGVRKGANVTGEALDKATKPIRETEAYRNVKNVIDDGSSSRYGGWLEKEERKRQREMREILEKTTGGKGSEVLQEDPK